MRLPLRQALALLALAMAPSQPIAATSDDSVTRRGCEAIAARVDALPGSDLLLRSYDDAGGGLAPKQPSLATAAFLYDNALATIALVACSDRPRALRIGRALRQATERDARLRNVYRSGLSGSDGPLPNGWWDPGENRWNEDAYQQGTATGNVAWVALALLTVDPGDGDTGWTRAAERLGDWILRETRTSNGFSGGTHGFDAAPERLGWKSTEHNVDAAALFGWLRQRTADPRWKPAKANAHSFIAAQWQSADGYFLIGSLPDGRGPNRDGSGLDAQLWPLLLPDAPRDWRRSLDHVVREYGVDQGFDYNTDRDGMWTEGSAQAALVLAAVGRNDEAQRALGATTNQFGKSGYAYATAAPRITTGLAIGPHSASADLYYYRWPHLGATAWITLAALRWNPFTGKPLAGDPSVPHKSLAPKP